MTRFVNHDRISNQVAAQHFYAPVALLVLVTAIFQEDTADTSS
jgi:hypothetical protein